MKKWEKAELKYVSISNTKFEPIASADLDGGYVGEGILGGQLEQTEDVPEMEEAVEEMAFAYDTEFVS